MIMRICFGCVVALCWLQAIGGAGPVSGEGALSGKGESAQVAGYFQRYHVSEEMQEQVQGPAVSRREVNTFVRKGLATNMRSLKRSRPKWWASLPPAKSNFSVSQERNIGKMVAGRILEGRALLKNEGASRYLNLVGLSVARQSMRPELEYRFFLLGEEEPAAYSTPGGFVIVTAGLVKLLEDEDELAFALGHETAHVARYHNILSVEQSRTRRNAKQAFGELDALAGTRGDQLELDAFADASFKIALGFQNRADELEADVLGTDFLLRAGYRAGAGKSVLAKLKLRVGDPAPTKALVATTHPTFQVRLVNLEKHLKTRATVRRRKMVRTRHRFEAFRKAVAGVK